jgi:signal transduction histidine kinase/DNA-binding response OmpR family regulator/CHASE3 domain sensor protein
VAAEVPLSRRLTTAFAFPVVLLAVVGALLGFQVVRMRDRARLVDHSDQVIARANEAQKLIIDQETALRGFLLTRDPQFLTPWRTARPQRVFREIEQLVADDAEQRHRLATLNDNYEQWLADSALFARSDVNLVEATRHDVLLRQKQKMDATRAAIASFMEAEERERAGRVVEDDRSARFTLGAFLVLLGFAAIGIATASARQLRLVSETHRAALSREKAAQRSLELQASLRAAELELARALQGELGWQEIGARMFGILVPRTHAQVGALYTRVGNEFVLRASHGLGGDAALPSSLSHDEGLLGRALAKGTLLVVRELPPGYLRVRSALGEHASCEVVLVPLIVDGKGEGMLELGFFRAVEPSALELLERIGDVLATAIRSADYRAKLRDLLAKTQELADELGLRQEELRAQNEELEEQARSLEQTQTQLETNQTELEQSNRDLVAQAALLEKQNEALREAQAAVTAQTAELERANRYKSEFLANVSHELRTPLNSSLLLAKVLLENRSGNLDAEQLRFIETMQAASNDLLALINDILDLSKIEAGKVELHPSELTLSRLAEAMTRMFEPMARDQGLGFVVETAEAPATLVTDQVKLQQILNNLLSNALKFTEAGSVRLRIAAVGDAVRFEVSDTGIGIPESERESIFEAFRQGNRAQQRMHGGTGLGLAISRDLARLLGGDVTLVSEVGRGSTLSLELPLRWQESRAPEASTPPASTPSRTKPRKTNGTPAAPSVADDRERLDGTRPLILVIEDDDGFASVLVDLVHELEFQAVVALTGEEGLRLARELGPHAVLLDISLPDVSGLSVLDRLKQDPRTRHVPVHVVSAHDFGREARRLGAIGAIVKPTDREGLVEALRRMEATFKRRSRRLLVIDPVPAARTGLGELLGSGQVEIVPAGTAEEALAALQKHTFDCVVTELDLPGRTAFELLETLAADDRYSFPPVIVYSTRQLSAGEEQRLRRVSDSIIVRGQRSEERLIDEVTLFLHQIESELPPERQRLLRHARDREALFENRRLLIVEDDVRSIFTLSAVLEPKGVKLEIARNGREALQVLETAPIELVLMDVTMPEMDGKDAIREIRRRREWLKLPIIALSSKGGRHDQAELRSAGINDYASKPIDVERLLSLIRVWLPPRA